MPLNSQSPLQVFKEPRYRKITICFGKHGYRSWLARDLNIQSASYFHCDLNNPRGLHVQDESFR
jgi:hypothetical protein